MKAESILRLAAVNFYLPSVQNRLIVEIVGDGLASGRAEYRVDDQSIESVCKKLSWTGKARQKLYRARSRMMLSHLMKRITSFSATRRINAAPPIEFAKKCLDPATEVVSTNFLGNPIMLLEGRSLNVWHESLSKMSGRVAFPFEDRRFRLPDLCEIPDARRTKPRRWNSFGTTIANVVARHSREIKQRSH
ncbi:MAG: hypothetical protein R3C05_14880 [Pirellulaceae bacterium]